VHLVCNERACPPMEDSLTGELDWIVTLPVHAKLKEVVSLQEKVAQLWNMLVAIEIGMKLELISI